MKKQNAIVIKVLSYLILLLNTPVTVQAEPLSEQDLDYTLQSYLLYAKEHNPGLRAAQAAISAQEKHVDLEASLPDPVLMANADVNGGLSNGSVGVTQEIPFPAKLAFRKKTAQHLLKRTHADLIEVQAELEKQIRSVYAALYATGQALKIQKNTMELVKQLEAVIRTKYAQSGATQGELLKVQVEVSLIEDEIRSLELEGDSQRRTLAALLPIESHERIPYPDSLPITEFTIEDSELMERIIAENPKLRGMKSEENAAGSNVSIAKSKFFPDFALSAEYMSGGMSPMIPGGNRGEWNVGVKVKLPVWFGKNRKEVEKAKEMEAQMRSQLAAMKNITTADARMLFNEFKDAARRVTLFNKVLIPQANQVLGLMQISYRTGKSSVLDLLDAQRTLLSLEIKHAREEAHREKAAAGILALLGGWNRNEELFSEQKVGAQ